MFTGEESIELNPDEMVFERVLRDSVDPFSFLAIASVCMGIFRSKFLPERWKILPMSEHLKNKECHHEWNCQCAWLEGRKINACSPLEVLVEGSWQSVDNIIVKKTKFVSSPVALIPPNGYNNADNHSKESLEWLSVVEKSYNDRGYRIKIQHARTLMGEKVVYYNMGKNLIKYKLDGFFEIGKQKFACEFYGYNWHGCPRCYIRHRDSTINKGKSMSQRYKETLLKEKRLKEMGYDLLTKWSCKFKTDLFQKPDLKEYVKNLNIVESIKIRDAYYGGRTNALCLYKKFENNEKGHYVDFCSLYPDVLKYRKFPIGHPEKIINNFLPVTYVHCNNETCEYNHDNNFHIKFPYFGIIKAKFLPPRDLLHPILPVRCNGKLKFPLCYNCADRDECGDCKCDDDKRCFTQTYWSGEVELALNFGYKIVTLYEVLHWEKFDQYDSIEEQGGIFTNYINAFLKIKQEASGIPEDTIDIIKYIEEYKQHEGILLIEENIKRNPGL